MRVLIVDDEPLVRKGLVSMLEKMELIDAVHEANNGETAKAAIEEFRPDLVFTDIVMPKADGIELLKWIMLSYPDIHSIVLSSHQDFNYVKQAFVFGAMDYVLKYDINEEILQQAIEKVMEKNSERDEIHDSKLEHLLFEGKGGRNYEQTGMVVLCILADQQEDFSALLESQKGLVATPIRRDYAYGVAPRTDAEQIAAELAKKGCFVGLSEFGYPADAVNLRLQAESAVARHFFSGEHKVYHHAPTTHELPAHINELKKEINAQIFDTSMAKLIDRLDALYRCVREESGVSVIAIKIMYTSIAELMAMKFPLAFQKSGITPDTINKSIIDARYLSDIRDIIDDCMKRIFAEFLCVLDTSGCSEITKKAIAYIQRHYGEGSLGLDTVAEAFGYTASYLSRIFKKETGVNVVDYINEIRILTAQKMLSEGEKKVYEVAEEVGYNNYNHFSKTFKRITGVTPSQYLENMKK